MTFLEILRDKVTDLPIEQNGDKSFRKIIKERIKEFGDIIDSSNNLSEEIDNMPFTPEIFKNRNRILRDGIVKCIDLYYEGRISKSYETLSEALNKSNITGYLDKNHLLNSSTNFYRIRVENGNFPLGRNELFHIPFEKRGKVSTQRFSIPGLPSLYLSNSIYLAWEELKRPNFNTIQAIRFSNSCEMNLLDLTTDIYNCNSYLIDNTSYGWSLLYKVMVWPLIAACSIRVKNPIDTFKPEYIIPQLLLQWVNKVHVDGIKYSSTQIKNSALNSGKFFNIVIPVKSHNQDKGYCDILSQKFQSTNVLPMQLRQFVSISDRLFDQETISTNVNSDVEAIELISGKQQPYKTTYFGILEHSLKGLDLQNVYK